MSITLNLTFFYGIIALLAIQIIINTTLSIDKHFTEKKLEKKVKEEQAAYFKQIKDKAERDSERG